MSTQTNWRGLPVHAVDQWDDWPLSLEDYLKMRDTWDLVRDVMESQLLDMALIHELLDHAARYERMQQAELDAGEDI